MNSRMEKYYKEDTVPKRSTRNQDLYDSIYDDINYTDFDINPQSRTINLEELRKLINPDDKQREIKREMIAQYNLEEDNKNYDVNEVLDKAKSTKVDDDKKRSISNTQYNILKNINLKNNSETDLKDLINTITTKNLINEDKDLFEDLKSLDNTTVGVPNDLNEIFKEDADGETRSMDETFFTKSMKLNTKDFESINNSLEKNNKLMRIIFIMIVLVILIILGFIIFKII